jgi:hypothetical protein
MPIIGIIASGISGNLGQASLLITLSLLVVAGGGGYVGGGGGAGGLRSTVKQLVAGEV